MPAPPRPAIPVREGADESDASWASFQATVLQAMQEQHQWMHEASRHRDEEQLRRLEKLTSSLLGEFGERLRADLEGRTVSLPPNPPNQPPMESGGGRKQIRSAFEASGPIANTVQQTLCDAGVVQAQQQVLAEAQRGPARGSELSEERQTESQRGSFAASSTARKTMALGNKEGAQMKQVHLAQSELSKAKKRKRLAEQETAHHTRLQIFANSNTFKSGCAFLIFANSLFIGVEVDFSMHGALQRPPVDNPEWFKVVNRCFASAFSLELVIRICAFGFELLRSDDRAWNAFDCILVLSFVLEEALDGMKGLNMSSIRVLRILRLIRTFRIIRIVNVFRSLRLMVCCIFNSLLSLLWALMLLLLTMYLFSIVCVQGTSSHLLELNLQPIEAENMSAALGVASAGSEAYSSPWSGDVWDSHEAGIRVGLDSGDDLSSEQMWSQLELQYRSVVRSGMTLLMCITGGVDWYEAVRPLLMINPVYAVLFSGYVVFVLFGVLNVLSAVFVEQALQIRDRDLLVQAEMERTRDFMSDMSELFKEADGDGSGILTREEMEEYLKNERVAMYMSTQQLDVTDVALMFRLLDADGTGEIEMDEFALGCFRLKGHARCLDVIRIMDHMDNMQNEIRFTRDSVEAVVGRLNSNANSFESQIRSSGAESYELAGRQLGNANPSRALSGDAAAGEALNGPPTVP